MTALQELNIEGCPGIKAEEMVKNLADLITQNSLAKITVSPDLLKHTIERQQLPCKWIPAIERYF